MNLFTVRADERPDGSEETASSVRAPILAPRNDVGSAEYPASARVGSRAEETRDEER